jgi:hypothetical protein
MFRGWVRALGFASALAAGGCAQEASLNVTWDFQGTEPASSGCGQHGVDSVLLTGTNNNGAALRQVVLCTPGQTTASLDQGSWSVALAMLDFQGTLMEPSVDASGNSPPDPIGTAQVSNQLPGAVLIHLTPVPACRDGVDNDGDGRVDLDDPDCQNNPDGVSE